jgi:hypothetical protein
MVKIFGEEKANADNHRVGIALAAGTNLRIAPGRVSGGYLVFERALSPDRVAGSRAALAPYLSALLAINLHSCVTFFNSRSAGERLCPALYFCSRCA